MCKSSTATQISDNKIIMILRAIPQEKLLKCVHALHSGGIRLIEVAFDTELKTSDAETAEIIKQISCEFPDMCVGAGTVLKAEQAILAAKSGARYIVSPNTDAAVINATKANGMVSIPGALTPSEICAAYELGADFVKVFPAGCMGPAYFAALRSPLGAIPLLAVGGIDTADIPAYIKSGVRGFGISTKILKPEYVAEENYSAITRLAKEYVSAVN